jgi:antirestriction protein ArdC
MNPYTGGNNMKYTGDVEGTLSKILEAFESGNLPSKMAQVFVAGAVKKHCASYSFMNRLIVMLHGYSDARGYGQWKKVGRFVKKGEKGFAILAPIMAKKNRTKDTGEVESYSFCVGFKAVKVFGQEQTEGKPIENAENVQEFLSTLPLLNVAEKWGIEVNAYNGNENGAYGFYVLNGKSIGLGTENLSTWAHELCHASDDRLGNLKDDKRWVSEVSAELAGAVLLEAIGYTEESDRGGAWDYISTYAKRAGVEPIDACRMVIGRVGKIVQQILDVANEAETVEA